MSDLITEYERAVEGYSSPRLRRLLREPRKALASRIVVEFARRARATVQIDARTFWGSTMTIQIPEPVSLVIYRYGLFEPGATRFLIDKLRSGMTFLDVGAHFGYFSLLAAHLIGAAGAVHSFEPTPRTFSILSENAKRHSNIHPVNVAAYSSNTTLEFNDYGMEYSAYNSLFAPRAKVDQGDGRAAKIRVSAIRIDDYVAQHRLKPALVKIDAESAENEVLSGMQDVLHRDRPYVILEVGDLDVAGAKPSRHIVESMCSIGYRAYEFDADRFQSHIPREKYESTNIFFEPN